MTVLPRGNPFAKSGTKKIVMESPIDLFYADMDAICEGTVGNMEQITHDWESFYKQVEVDAANTGLIYDREMVNQVVSAHDTMFALGDTVELKVPQVSNSSPDAPQKLGYLNYEISRAA